MDIPDTFHDLPRQHYPLVITFRKFLMMLDGTIRSSFFDKFSNNEGEFSPNGCCVSRTFALQVFTRKEVNYEKFVGSYWPHFNTKLTKKLDASIVYTEIMSHIKGGLESGSFLNGKLGRRNYVMLADKRVSFLCEETRENIYDIFLDYEKRKLSNGEFDISDFVIDLHQRLGCDLYPGEMFDFVYVDEVQDLTMRQIALLKYVCTNYENGFIFAGDTAQTIARGVDFRFEDIRCLFYLEFLSELRIDAHELKKERAGLKDNFQLNENFRTHSGVLKLAKSIMDLLYSFFPLNVDRISPEISLIYGESPVLLESNDDENAIITIFGSTTGERCNMNEFGAEQVILVRDACAKKQIVDLVGNKALVLTIIECKGLEFQDVLLYNFFGGSLLKNNWRVVYEYMDNNGFGDQSAMSYPNFNHGRHNLLCSELKQLYVAVTRTRQRLWICENSNDYCKPMVDYWKSLCLVQVRQLDSSLAQAMRAVSTPDDWRLRGIKLFNEENFEMATMCFERAGDTYREKWARAAGLVCTADRFSYLKPEEAAAVLKKAAAIYESIGKPESAATCYIKFKDFNSAGRLYMEKCGESRLELAGDCFAMIEHWSLAADLYAKAKCFSKCLSMCSQGELFDAGLHFIKHWKEDSKFKKIKQLEQDVEKSFLENCVMHYVKIRDISHMVEFTKILQSMDIIRNVLKSRKCLDELLELETLMENYLEAADIAHFKGDILLEADMLQKAGHFKKSAGLILLYIIVNSLWAPGSKGWPLKKFAQKEKLLFKLLGMAKKISDSFHDQVSSEIYVLSDRPKDLFNLAKHLVEARKYHNIRLQIFTLREIIDVHLRIDPSEYIWEPGMVSDVEKHANLVMAQNICSVESLMHIWKLWKEHIHNVLSHLTLSMRSKGSDFELYEQFCFEYFGVLIGSDQNSFVLLNPKAAWINSCKTAQKERNLSMMDIKQYKASAQRYWRLELLSLAVEVMEKLESLLSFSKFCAEICSTGEVSADIRTCKFLRNLPFPFSKGRVILAMNQVVKFLSQSDIISVESIDKITRIYTSSREYFFSILFPIKWKDGSNLSMLDFHRNVNAKEIIEEYVDKDLRLVEGKQKFDQVGRMVMLLFLTGDLNDKIINKIILHLDQMLNWKNLIIRVRNFLNCSSLSISLIYSLERALEITFRAIWSGKYEYMSPHCFIYLVDCLLFGASSCLGSGGLFFSTKSILFEMLRCHGLKGYMETCFVALNDSQAFDTAHICLNSIIHIIKNLLMNKRELLKWVAQFSVDQFDYGYLISKMVIILCLANINSGRTLHLWEFLSQNNILVDLHEGFCDAIVGCLVDSKNITVFANALKIDHDSLVIVTFKENVFDFSKFNAIVIMSEELRFRKDVIAKLFKKASSKERQIQSEQELAGSNSSGNVHSMCLFEEVVDHSSSIQTELFEKNEQLDLAMRLDEDVHTCLQMCVDFNTCLGRCHEIKLEYIIHCLSTLVQWFSKDFHQREGAPDILLELRRMLLEIMFHSSLIDGGVKLPCTTIEELERRCPGWKSNLISLIDSLIKEINYSAESIPEVNEDCCKETCDITDNFPEVNEDCCKETCDITDNCIAKEESPHNRIINKGNGKKSKQKGNRKGKGKGKKR